MENIIISGINQFKDSAIEKILEHITAQSGTLLDPTISLCHQCHYHIPAYRFRLNNKVFICKHCAVHGTSVHMIESDAEFYDSLVPQKAAWNWDGHVLIEASDRCNIDCPHCYHLPDNKIKDVAMTELLDRIKQWPKGVSTVMLAGAEASLRKDFVELSNAITDMGLDVSVLTNGIKFADEDFAKDLRSSNMIVTFGLNHPDYIGNPTIREKQVRGIEYCLEHLSIGYIGYTLVSLAELDYVLNEILNSGWTPSHFRVRCGSEIGRNATEDSVFVSTLYKAIEQWAADNGKSFKRVLDADNNIYHVVVELEGRLIRVIQWCDETNIDMEELRSGPWCDFTGEGITNFLHQVIRRDTLKNKGIMLPDKTPLRYQFGHQYDTTDIFDRSTH